jgi:hypothetical protein
VFGVVGSVVARVRGARVGQSQVPFESSGVSRLNPPSVLTEDRFMLIASVRPQGASRAKSFFFFDES